MREIANEGNVTCCSQNEVYFSYAQRQVIASVCIFISFLGTTGNLMVVAAVVLSKKLRHGPNMFVFNLSIADLVTCVYVIPMGAVAGLNKDHWPLPMAICKLAAFLFVVCLGCSINNLVCIAINRYIMVLCNRSTYLKLYSCRRTLIAVMLTWILPVCTVIITVSIGFVKLGFNAKYSACIWISEDSSNFALILAATFIPLQFSVILFSYIRIFCHVFTHTKKIRALDNRIRVAVVMNVPNQQQARQRQLRRHSPLQLQVTKNLFCVVCIFVLCILPISLALVMRSCERLVPFAVTCLAVNSCANPIIYAAKHPHFRKVFRSMLCGKFAQIPERISCKLFN